MAIQIAGNQVKAGAIDTTQLADDSIDANKLDLSQNYLFTGLLQAQTPSNNADVATKSYVDGIVGNGVFWKEPCEVATTVAVNISNPGTSTFDGVSISSGDRVLVRAQGNDDKAENGIYVFNGSSSAMTRATDADSAQELQSAAVFINSGSTFSDQAFVETETIGTLGVDDVDFVRFSGLGIVEAGTALSKSSDTLNVNFDGSSIDVNGSDQLIVKALGVTNAMLAGSIEAGKLAGSIGDAKLNQLTTANKVAGSAVQLNGSGGLENSSGLKIADLGVSNAMLAGSITAAKLAGSIGDDKLNQLTTADKVAGSAVQLADGGGLTDATGLKIDASGVTNAMLAGSIADSKLNQLTTADKVAGSAVQLAGSGGLEDSSGLQISTGGVSNAMLAGSIADSKLLQITAANKVAGSAVQLNGSGGLEDNAGLRIEAGGIVESMIGNEEVSSSKLDFEPTTDFLTTNGSTTAFALSSSVPDGFDDVLVIRNGLVLDRVESSPADADEYTSSISNGTCTVTFGAAPASSDKVRVKYFGLK
jgi:hypothetical protein